MPIGLSAANEFLTRLRGKEQQKGSVYLGFLTAAPTISVETGAQLYVEPTPISVADNGYRRVHIGDPMGTLALFDAPEFNSTRTTRLIKNGTTQIVGTECVNENWTGILCFGLFSSLAVGSGNLLAWGTLQDAQGQPISSAIVVTTGKIPIFRVDALELSFALTES